MPGSLRHQSLAPPLLEGVALTVSAATAISIQGASQQIGWKFYANTTSPVSSVDVNLAVTGTVTGHTYTLEVQADSSDTPSGTALGAATSAFAGPASSGFTGAKALGSNTGALTLNAPYWVVMKVASGTPDGSNFVQARSTSTTLLNREKLRQHNGTNWTTTTAVSGIPLMVRTHADGSFGGSAVTAAITGLAGVTDVFGTNRQAVRFKVGAGLVVRGVMIPRILRASSPSNLEVCVYEGSTLKTTDTITSTDVPTSAAAAIFWLASPPTLTAGATGYILLRQNGNGGNDSNDYDCQGVAITSTYVSAHCPPDLRMVFGTGDDPTAYTVSSDYLPTMLPLFDDPATDLTSVAAASYYGSQE